MIQKEENERLFFLEDETCLNSENRENIRYANKDFCCVQYGSYLCIESYDGTLYARLPYGEEESSGAEP